MKGLVALVAPRVRPMRRNLLQKAQKPYANAALNLVNVYYIKYSSSLIMQTQKEMCDQAIIFRPGV